MPKTIIDSVTLNFTDITGAKTGCTKLGSNKFWKGWVEDNKDGTGNYECRWGATGTPGKDTGSKRGIDLDTAKNLLNKKVKSKEKKGYTRLAVRSDQEEMVKAADNGIDLDAKKKPKRKKAVKKSSFHSKVGHLLATIYGETSRIVTAGLSAQAGATVDNPIGNLSDDQLDIGGGILDDIEYLLTNKLGHEDQTNRTQALALVKHIPSNEIIDLTNQFMSNIPRKIAHDMRGKSNLHRLVISSFERLEEQRKFLQLLRDVHLTKDIFKAVGSVASIGDKEQIWYDGLNCLIKLCEAGSPDFKKVAEIFNTNQSKRNANWFRGGRSTLHLKSVFKFTRNDTEKAFKAYAKKMTAKPNSIGNIFAWHGTRTENLLGISQTGLLMPENLPRGIHVSGKAFGKGIYHSPAWSATGTCKIGQHDTDGTNGALKSMNYTSSRGAYYGSNNTANSSFMYLQEVALGKSDVHTSACWDQRRPNNWPDNDFIMAASSGCHSLSHDEIVTFNQDAQIFRYLVEIEVR